MKYRIFTSIMGWFALLLAGIGILCWISAQGPGHTLQDRETASLMSGVGVILGIGWIWSRKRIREKERQARMLRRGLHRIRQ